MSDTFLTIGDLTRLTGQPEAIVNYAIARHGPAPVGKVANARVWLPADLDAVKESLAKTANRSTIVRRREAVAS